MVHGGYIFSMAWHDIIHKLLSPSGIIILLNLNDKGRRDLTCKTRAI